MRFVCEIPWWIGLITLAVGCLSIFVPLGIASAESAEYVQDTEWIKNALYPGNPVAGSRFAIDRYMEKINDPTPGPLWMAVAFWIGLALVLVSLIFLGIHIFGR